MATASIDAKNSIILKSLRMMGRAEDAARNARLIDDESRQNETIEIIQAMALMINKLTLSILAERDDKYDNSTS